MHCSSMGAPVVLSEQGDWDSSLMATIVALSQPYYPRCDVVMQQ